MSARIASGLGVEPTVQQVEPTVQQAHSSCRPSHLFTELPTPACRRLLLPGYDVEVWRAMAVRLDPPLVEGSDYVFQ